MQQFNVRELVDDVKAKDTFNQVQLEAISVSALGSDVMFESDKDKLVDVVNTAIANSFHNGASRVTVQANDSYGKYLYIDDNGRGLNLWELKEIYSGATSRTFGAMLLKSKCDALGVRVEYSTAQGLGFGTVLYV